MRRFLQLVLAAAFCDPLAACATHREPLEFRTTPGSETPAVAAGPLGRIAIAHKGDGAPCEPLQPVARGKAGACLRIADVPAHGADVAVVPESARSILALRLAFDKADPKNATFTLVRRTCEKPGFLCAATEQTILTWTVGTGSVLYGKSLALSPDGRSLALVPSSRFARLKGFAPPAPEGHHFADQQHVGDLVIVDLPTGAQRDTGIAVVDEQTLSWSKDGRRLLVVRPETIDRLTPAMRDELRGREGETGEPLPVIERVEVATGETTMLAIGLDPLWSPDGHALLFAPVRAASLAYRVGRDPAIHQAPSEAYELRDLSTGTRSDVVLPGLVGRHGPVAFVSERRILYWGLPSPTVAPALTSNDSPLVGPKQMLSLKVGDLDTGAFATVVWSIDPRAQVGFSDRE